MAAGTFIHEGQDKLHRFPSSHAISPMSQTNPFESELGVTSMPIGSERPSWRSDSDTVSAILMRKLPRHTSSEALRTMFLFAKDFVGAEFVPTEAQEDKGFLSAIARFKSPNAAQEARALLDGKQNAANETPMIVEVLRLSPGAVNGQRRNTNDMASSRAGASSASSSGSANGQGIRQSSRFNGAFQALDRISPPTSNGQLSSGELSQPDLVSPFPNFFTTPMPIGQQLGDRHRASGKNMIREDGADDEAGDLLKDPMAFAQNDLPGLVGQTPRRVSSSQVPTSRFGGLSLSTNNVASGSVPGLVSPRASGPLQSPTTAMSPTSMGNLGPNASYQMANQHYQRHNYPPVNPADQNPPCNTLYVGNLPIDTSEDELKAMFSKQRGYKRLCFRTKQNGPMCFVEFEDISFATKALNELYGHPLHNSVKGGIRLSFSKNPLGVRTGQPGNIGPPTPMSPQGPMPNINGLGNMTAFATASGPPPGLTAPPGLSSPLGVNGNSVNSIGNHIQGGMMSSGFSSNGLGINGFAVSGTKSPTGNTTSNPWSGHGVAFTDYMVGR
ncbi:MAG: hypothetical protein Q9214_001386 [Letrouitia sp. 1 TL-2023]